LLRLERELMNLEKFNSSVGCNQAWVDKVTPPERGGPLLHIELSFTTTA
jgi:hypothetical protein